MTDYYKNRTVLFVSGVRGDTRRYRTIHPYEQLRSIGVPAELSHITDPALSERVERSAVVILHRVAWDDYVKSVVEIAKTNHSLILVDHDDLIFDPSAFRWINSAEFSDPLRVRMYKEEMQRYRQTVEMAMGSLTSTDYLVEQIKPINPNAWVHRNGFSFEMQRLSQQAVSAQHGDQQRIVLGYASGTPTHDRDFIEIKPVLQSILKRYKHVELWLVGSVNVGSGWDEFEAQTRFLPLVPWRKLPQLLAQFDINLAPLVLENPFSQSKSEIKWMEAGLVEVPTIASPTDAFRYAIRNGENGFLASDLQGWESALCQLIDRKELRQAVGKQAAAGIQAAYHPQARGAQLYRILAELSQNNRSGQPLADLLTKNPLTEKIETTLPIDLSAYELHPTLRDMAVYTMKHRGLKAVVTQIWIYTRRSVTRRISSLKGK